jgi:putative flavoprotein involved in K+ transport
MSAWFSGQAIDHVVLERGEIANAWRHERWDSLRLLTPNWQSRLPGYRYAGGDPDGFMSMPDVIGFIDGYARAIAAPVRTGTTVVSVRAADGGFRVVTQRGQWRCRAVVLASGAHHVPDIPACASELPKSLSTLPSKDYRNPRQLEDRGVLIVGASATGLQLADEIQRSGREVTLAVGEHVRMPRLYRGADIQRWMEAAGILDQRYDEVDDIVRARRVPSPQLTGTGATLDLNLLRERGVNIVGRLVDVRDGVAQFSGSLRNHCAMADLKLTRLLDTIDAWITGNGDRAMAAPERFEATYVEEKPRLMLDLKSPQIGTVIWATGSRPDYSWLQVPALDRKGQLRHDGGVVAVPGMYALGLPFLRRRKSSFIHGAEDDVRELGEHLRAYLDRFSRTVSSLSA